MSEFVQSSQVRESKEALDQVRANIARYLKGKDDVIEQVLVCLTASGHLLMEDLPGVGKTTLAYCLARSIDCSFSRIQFTSDLLPSDVTGVSIYDERIREFVFKPGPVFANFVLADEINRATPKTQSSLLEVMDRGKVTMDGHTHPIGEPFMVFATQNPIDYEGTFPLPESQLDRFLMRLSMGYPDGDDELNILRGDPVTYDHIRLDPVLSRDALHRIQTIVPRVFVEDSILEYILKIVSATRTESEFKAGVSVRGSTALKRTAQAAALIAGRDFVIPADVSGVIMEVFAHRLALRRSTADPLEERRAVMVVLRRIISAIRQPS